MQSFELVAGVPHVAAYGGVGPLAGAVAVEPQVQLDQPRTASTSSLENRSAFIRLRVSLAPTTSWWWKVTVPSSRKRRVLGLPTSCINAAKREMKSGAEPGQARFELDRLLEHLSVCS